MVTNTQLLNDAIKASGRTKTWLADQLGLSAFGLAKKINNETEFKASEISKLCDLLGIKSMKEQHRIFFAADVD